MRELRVIGVDADGGSVVCQDSESGEKFRLPADDRLRAALRGDISRLGQIEIEMDSSLRPREIQSRIRAGASVAQVAAAAGVSYEKIERFAHPVLLERTRAAELAASAHPIAIDGPTPSTLGEVVASALGARGVAPDDAVWDAWKGDDGRWIVQVGWRMGRSEMHAHWRYLPGSGGGTADPLDETADELTDRDLTRPLSGAGSVVALAAPPPDARASASVTVDAGDAVGAARDRSGAHARRPLIDDTETGATLPESTLTPTAPDHSSSAMESSAPAPSAGTDDSEDDHGADRRRAPRRRAARKPAVPAWEDVLLGVRSNGNH